MSDENDSRAKRSQKLAADLFLDEGSDAGTAPDLEIRQVRGPTNDPPTVPIDVTGYQEMPRPEVRVPILEPELPITFPAREISARQSMSPPPLSFPRESSARSKMSLPPAPPAPAITSPPLRPRSSLSNPPLPPLPSPPPLREVAPEPSTAPMAAVPTPLVSLAPPPAPRLPTAAPSAPPPAPLSPTVVSRPLSVALPATVLVIDEDVRAGSMIAQRLLELGYGVRVVRWAEVKSALGAGRYQTIVAEVPAEDTRNDGGRSMIEPLSMSTAPIILTSSAVFRVELLRALPRVSAALTKPFFVEVLVSAIESARKEAPRLPIEEEQETQPLPSPAHLLTPAPEPEVQPLTETVGERRTAERHEFDVNVVRAVIIGGPEQQPVRGRVRNLSLVGGMLIDTASRVAAKTAVAAELTLYEGRMMLFSGRVVRQMKNELALKLDADEAQRGFLGRFIEDARATDGRALQPIRINVKEEASSTAMDDVALMKRWLEVSDQIEDDAAQQRFIQECLRAERIEFAIARYRDLKASRPDDEKVAKYLLQLGTILSFKVLSKKEIAAAPQKMPSSLKMVIGLFALAGVALLFILLKVLKK